MFHLVRGVSILQSQWIIARSSSTPTKFITMMARFIWTKRGLTQRCFKLTKNIKNACTGDTRKVITPKKTGIFIGNDLFI